MITILGQHIAIIRPALVKKQFIFNCDKPRIKYNKKPRTVQEHTGKVRQVCVKLFNDKILGLPAPATHVQVCEKLAIDIDSVITTGWQLDNGNYLWR